MRRVVVSEFVSLDGVMEAPGGEEGHPHSGWVLEFDDPGRVSVPRETRGPGWGDLVERYSTIAAVVVVVAIFAATTPSFLSGDNLTAILTQISVLAIVATGMTLCVAVGEFDLSVGSVVSLSGILSTKLIADGTSVVVALLVALAAGVTFGLANGLLATLLRVPSLVVTLASSAVAVGANYAYSGGASIYGTMPRSFQILGQGRLDPLGIPVIFVIACVVTAGAYVVLERSIFGRRMIATGLNATMARFTGIKTHRYRILGLVSSALLAAAGGILLASYIGSGQPDAGAPYLLNALTVVFVGMSTIRPGQANILGSLVGVVLLGVIANGLNLLGSPFWVTQVVSGGILILAVLVAALRGNLKLFSN